MNRKTIDIIKKELSYMPKIKEEIDNIKVKVKKTRILSFSFLVTCSIISLIILNMDLILQVNLNELAIIIWVVTIFIFGLIPISSIFMSCFISWVFRFIGYFRKNFNNKNSQTLNFLEKHTSINTEYLNYFKSKDLQPISNIISHISADNLEIYHSISSDLDLNGDDKEILSKILSKMFLNENTIDFHKYKSYSEIIINESLNFDLFIEKTFSFFCDKASNQDFSKNANDILNLISNINNAPIKNKSLKQYKDKKNITLMINNTDDEIEIERQKNKTKKPINKIISI